ncbi:MAG: HAMP domain-containing histidine kinase, partial [Dinghuibacter sp.]|nr:HAMP domain-containing histidine kinase [Dinghuibacter sp.]
MLRKFWADISYSGVNYNDISFDSKRQVIFNQLNFLAIATCIVRLAFMGTTMTRSFTMLSFISCIIPIGICAGIGLLNWLGRYDYAKLVAFLLLPPAIAFVALVQKDHGLSIFPLIFCILSFFFLEKKRTIFIAFINSSIWFVTLQFAELLHNDSGHFFSDLPLIIFNHVLILSLVFLLLNFIRKMVLDYQEKLAVRGKELAVKNGGLLVQQREILNKTKMLEERQVQLETANREKNKMMSVISHDLRTPVLSVKNLLELHVKGVVNDAQILQYVPELNREMSNVIDLLENLLAWSKQENREIKSERVELPALVNEIQGVYQFYARSKSVQIVSTVPDHVSVMADRQMIKVV